ncbi:MAG: glycosyltransferase family 4 protein [Actinobacteria bacterium]|nr:glycosyltransferase family 4 protein [Actinomycetota bacterium]
MKIAIDATIVRKENTGVGFYVINLLSGLCRADDHNEYYIFMNKNLLSELSIIKKKNINIIHKNFKSRFFRIFWQLFILPFNLRSMKISLLHSTNYITPLIKIGFKIIVTIHDFTFYLFPEKYTIMKRIFYKSFIPFFIKISDKVITDSNNTKKDIFKIFNISERKITVIYVSYQEYYNNIKNNDLSKKILMKYNINRNFILFVGMIEPRKNILSILKAFIEIDEELDLDLVIVGKKGWYFKEIDNFMEKIKGLKLTNKIIFTGYVPEKEIKYFYQSALIFVFPSFYEGFGLPPLQAMACGTPVITSNVSSLPEVVGDSAIRIDPNNLEELTNSIKLLYNNPAKRSELIRKGLKQAKKFNLIRIAKKTISIYETFK